MTRHFLRDLDNLKKAILEVGAIVENAIHLATTALLDRRPELAEEVIRGDAEIDRLEVAIEEDCLKILALHQPVAADLRFTIAVLKVNNDLERMGDLAANIAGRAIALSEQAALPRMESFERMVERVREMVGWCLNALINKDTDLARKVLEADDDVDDAHRSMYDRVQALMKSDSETIDRAIHLLSASRALERIADQATNIAEDVLFLVEGEIIRHRPPGAQVLPGPGSEG